MNDRVAHARGWFKKADSDLTAARRVLETGGPFDTACFHSQQAVEKLLKGFLAWRDEPFPHTHNLEELLALCLVREPSLGLEQEELAALTPYAIQVRYDFEFWPGHDTAREAFGVAEGVRETILALVPPEARP